MTVIEKIDGEDVEFPALLLPDYEPIQAAVRAELMAQANARLDACKVNGMDRYSALRDTVPVFIAPSAIDAYLSTTEGLSRVLLRSLAKNGSSDETAQAIVSKINFMLGRDIAMRVIGFRDVSLFSKPAGTGQPDTSPAP